MKEAARSLALGSAVVALLAACSDARRSDSADTIVLEAADVHPFGTSDAIAIVEDLEVLPDGRVWVLNSVEPVLIGFAADGDVVSSYGRIGGGPDELGEPAGLMEGGMDGSAWLLDTRRHAVREVAGPDRAGAEVVLPREEIPPGTVFGTNPFRAWVRTARMGDEIIVPRRAQAELTVTGVWVSIWTGDLVAVDAGRSTARDVLSLGAVLGDPTGRFDVEGSGLPFPLWYRLWTVCGGDELRVYDRLGNRIRRFTAEGTELAAQTLPPVTLTDVSARRFATAVFDVAAVAGMGEVPSGGIRMSAADSARVLDAFLPEVTAGGEQLANLLPRYVDLRCDAEGTQWIHAFDINAPGTVFGGLRGGRVWLKTTADGETQGVRMPDRFDPYRFTSDRIWGVQRDELDVATVAWIAAP